MLTELSITNYALIDELKIDLSSGLSIITGETGAGKSILLGALGLVLGNRVDTTSLKDTEKKCVIETKFAIAEYHLNEFFDEVDLDYDDHTIIRREILPSGKSRAFVNDTPVTLATLVQLKENLIDVHSQHQTLHISNSDFQLGILDAMANNQSKLISFQKEFIYRKKLEKELEILVDSQKKANQQYDYNLYLYNELSDANVLIDEQDEIEERLEKLNHVEEIKMNLSEAVQMISNEEIGVQNLLNNIENRLSRIAGYSNEYQEFYQRINSVKIEIDDLMSEFETANESVDFHPDEAVQLNDRLQLLYDLQKKHYVASNKELLQVLNDLEAKVNSVANADEEILEKQKEFDEVSIKLDRLGLQISKARQKVIPRLKSELEKLLSELNMPNARFSIQLNHGAHYFRNGKDEISLLFSANKGGNFGELKKVASGGELSRIMLALKKVLSENVALPTVIFDEIDTGVSGEVSNRMASIMQEMSQHMQVITITHLPQIAAKGDSHFKVFKESNQQSTHTKIKLLNAEDRVAEIAEMLGGKDISDSAFRHAQELLN